MAKLVVVASFISLALVACDDGTRVPKSLTGSYVRESPSLMALLGSEETLIVMESGATVAGGAMPSIEAVVNAGPSGSSGRVGISQPSDLFAKVKCGSAESCSFTTKGGCEGSIEKQGQKLAIVAQGTCASWSGTWVAQASRPAS